MSKIVSFVSKDVALQIKDLTSRGGQYQKAAEKVKSIIHDIRENISPTEVFKKLKTTNHGESRIQHVVKYDLSGFCRLITIHHDSSIVLLFVGDHEQSDKWLENNKGLTLTAEDKSKGLFTVYQSQDINDENNRLDSQSDFSAGKLYLKLRGAYDRIKADVPRIILKAFESFETEVGDEEILEAAEGIANKDKSELFFDVFIELRAGNIDEAKNRILLFEEKLTPLEELTVTEASELTSNDTYLNIKKLEAEYLQGLLNSKDWYDWMLFLHPEQQKIMDNDYSGSARLLGVSGSGKTCVLVHRAVRLAEKYSDKEILIITLNKSLSQLINKLIDLLLETLDKAHLKKNIKITSLWELCRNMLIDFDDKKTLSHRSLNIITDKHNESVDEIWEEYYQCKLNNNDAEVLFPLHQNLLARGIYPQDYLKQEFDWIRSAFEEENRSNYLKIEREGRYFQIYEEDRNYVLDGLKYWEKKMEDIGVIDPLGFSNALYKHIEKVKPKYRCVLVDEVQDFGTLELKLIRQLVEVGENDIFICGDIAQQVYNKQHKIRLAGINILPEGFVKILKNYRNSREILEASYKMFTDNVNIDQLKTDDFEILNPEFANFSSPKPFIRNAISLNQELNSALEYLNHILDENKKEKGCIAVCGYTIFNLSQFGQQNNLKVLDGETDLSSGNIFLSDLEQTKGFEFDRMIIINCNKNIIPNPVLPKEEWHREVSKLYVAMTRAKKDLVISYSRDISGLLEKCGEYFTFDSWADHVKSNKLKYDLPDKSHLHLSKIDASELIGKTLLYHKKSVGFSKDLQNKLIEHVAGKNITDERRKKIGWINIAQLKSDIESSNRDLPSLSRTFGPTVFQELDVKIK
ncbi:ATP-dependent helicase [Agrobacterium tumefaciens]|nr:ATP-dependent helicase [Agrobacterium tumefaciens]NTE24862.1 ATP-dependent helicase [Agrobacterium tumefaciens]